MTEEEREKKNVSVGTTPFMVTTRISVVAIDNFNYLKKPQLPTLSEPLSIDCAGQFMDPSIACQSMDNYTILKVSNSYSRLNNPITIYITYK